MGAERCGHLCPECDGDQMGMRWEYNTGHLNGAAVAFGLMGMAEAIRKTYCFICDECGYVAHNEQPCCCWNDE